MNNSYNQLGSEYSEIEILEAKNNGRLLSMELELSMLCNLRCLYCYASSGNRISNELSFEEITDGIDQACMLGAKKIIVLGGGEPLAYPRINDVLDYIMSRGLKADLFTNGTLITEAVADYLCRNAITTVVKQNSFIPERQDRLAGCAGAWQKIKAGLHHLMKAGYPEKATLGIQTVVTRINYDEIPDIWRWARKNSLSPYVETMNFQGRAREYSDLAVDKYELKHLFERLSHIDENEFGNRWEPHPPLAASHCRRHEYSCTLKANGDVIPCPGVDIPCGNIRERNLGEIIGTSRVFMELRNIRRHIGGKCAVCKYGEHCYGCRGHAFQVTGDYLAEDPLCWIEHEV